MRISDWSSDVCSSDLVQAGAARGGRQLGDGVAGADPVAERRLHAPLAGRGDQLGVVLSLVVAVVAFLGDVLGTEHPERLRGRAQLAPGAGELAVEGLLQRLLRPGGGRSEEHTSEPQSIMRTSYAVFCLI